MTDVELDLPVLLDPNRPLGTKKVFVPYRPFALVPRLPIEVVNVEVDGQDVTEDAVDATRCRVRPHVLGAGWGEVVLVVRMADPTGAIVHACFAGRVKVPIAYFVRIECDKQQQGTRLRRGARFVRDGAGTLSATVRIARRDMRLNLSLVAFAVRADDAKPKFGVASRRGARLAMSPSWIVEEIESEGLAGGAFDFAYVDFADPQPGPGYAGEDAVHLRASVGALSHVAFRAQGPLVLLNVHRREVRDVLLSKGTRGVRARLRDVLLGEIATHVWRTIVAEAYFFCRPESGQPTDDDFEWGIDVDHWSFAVLEHVVRKLSALSDVEELLCSLHDDARRAGLLLEIGETLGRIGSDAPLKLLREVEG